MKVSERLLQRLREELALDIPEGAYLDRAPGATLGANRTGGEWVWTVYQADHAPLATDSRGLPLAIGSQWTMTELVKYDLAANQDLYGDVVIEPTDEEQRRTSRTVSTTARSAD